MLGDIYFGIIFSVLNGENILGMVSFKSTPISLISKNGSSDYSLSFEDPIEPIADISKVSAPLKIFLINKLGFNEKPTV